MILNDGDNMNQHKAPLYDALVKHTKRSPISLHVPGHKNGLVFQPHTHFQSMLRLDVTELDGLDDLHSPEGVLLEAESLLAELYQVEKSFFLVNGSTVGNLAMLLATLKNGDTVFVQRNCHKSILHGVELAQARPVLLNPEPIGGWGVAGGITLETVKRAYELYPNCKAIVLTYPNYYGMIFQLDEIIEFAHTRGIPVLIDEAHGAHFIGGSIFPSSALELGADVVVQSAHKTLPAMTMGSFLHVNSKYISSEGINHYLRILQSSSPSYPIMASLDLARKYLGTYVEEDQEYLMDIIKNFKDELRRIPYLKVLPYPNGGDPLKVTVQSRSNCTGFQLQKEFEKLGIYTEMADPNNVLFVLPLLKRGMPFPFKEIISRLRSLHFSPTEAKSVSGYIPKKEITTLTDCSNRREIAVPFEEAVGYICSESIIPYPPGIPLFIPGEKITSEDIKSLRTLLRSGARFQGGMALGKGKIKVYQ